MINGLRIARNLIFFLTLFSIFLNSQTELFNNLDAPKVINTYNSPFLFYNDSVLQESTVLNFELFDPYAEKFPEKKPIVTIAIKDAQNNFVKTILQAAPLSLGFHQFSWDGKNQTGVVVLDGSYYFQIDTADDLGNTATFYSYVVKGALPLEIKSPTENEPIYSGVYEIKGTAAKLGLFKRYVLEYAAGSVDAASQGSAVWKSIPVLEAQRGSGLPENVSVVQIQDGTLASWDTRGIVNGAYTIRLTVIDKYDGRTVVLRKFTLQNPIFIANVIVDRDFITPGMGVFPFTKISYQVTKPSDITLRFFDTKGTVDTSDDSLVFSVLHPGFSANFQRTSYEDKWLGQNFSSSYVAEGNYRLEIKAQSSTEVASTNVNIKVVRNMMDRSLNSAHQ